MADLTSKSKRLFDMLVDQQWVPVCLDKSSEGCVVRLPDRELRVDAATLNDGAYSLLIDGNSFDVTVRGSPSHYSVTVNGVLFEITLRDPRQRHHQAGSAEGSSGPAAVTAPMPGKLVTLIVSQGDSVKAGQGVAVVEAMKMQNELKAPKSGIVEKVCVVEGQAVNAGECLLTIQ